MWLFVHFAAASCRWLVSKVGIQMGNQLSRLCCNSLVVVRLPNARTPLLVIGSFSSSWL